MIIQSGGGTGRTFLGVNFVVLAHGTDSMLTKMLYKTGDKVPAHRHSNEQNGYVISGKYRLRFGEFDRVLVSGDSYCIPRNAEHGIDVIEPGEVLDCFTPPRQDYL